MTLAMLWLGAISDSLGKGTMILAVVWLGGILLCAVPYILSCVLNRADRGAARPRPPAPEARTTTTHAPSAGQDKTW